MDYLTLMLSLAILAALYYCHRRAVAAARHEASCRGERHTRHGLRPLPIEVDMAEYGETVVRRAVELLNTKQAKGWSQALKLAADEAKGKGAATTRS